MYLFYFLFKSAIGNLKIAMIETVSEKIVLKPINLSKKKERFVEVFSNKILNKTLFQSKIVFNFYSRQNSLGNN